MSVCPTSSTQATMKYDVYRHKDATEEGFISMDKFFKQVENEDKELCIGAQTNLNTGTYTAGELQPDCEEGVLHFQKLVREAVIAHRQKEEESEEEIWPARYKAAGNSDMDFCSNLEKGCMEAKMPSW